MIFIQKGAEPRNFSVWKKLHPEAKYEDIPSSIKQELYRALLRDQGHICGYCGIGLDYSNPHDHNIIIDHVNPRKLYPEGELSFSNMIASCNSLKDMPPSTSKKRHKSLLHCDLRKETHVLPITPYQKDCSRYFYVDVYGEICPSPKLSQEEKEKAKITCEFLGLNDNRLVEYRKKLINTIRKKVINEGKSLEETISDYESIKNGFHNPFYFVPRLAFVL